MKRLFLFSVLALALVSFSVRSFAQDGAKKMIEEPGETTLIEKSDKSVVLSGTVVMTATIQALNVKERIVVLADAEGNVRIVEVIPEVNNFDQLAIGDVVTSEFYESVALQIAEPDAKPMETEGITVVSAPRGAKPGVVKIKIISEIVEVVGVNRKYNILRYRAPGKQVAILKVDPKVSTMTNLKPGKKILVTRTEAVAISVQKP
ncbi:MAG: hypothetical protein E2O70_04315 [Candidatus Dadabacteria bacterium]|nr:MAG: hypothetical protein E2O70_04315 [Candidatus Dadabacteria bacterium]